MTITVEAVYENGTLKLDKPLPLREQEKVQVTVHTAKKSPLLEAYGIMGWTGDAETLERILEEAEYSEIEEEMEDLETR